MLSVIEASPTQDLTRIETVAAELDVPPTDTARIEMLEGMIRQASALIANYCHRVFGLETVRQTFSFPTQYRHRATTSLWLERYPVRQILSISEGTYTLVSETDYLIDMETGELRRSWAFGWGYGPTVIEYKAGYELLPDLPYDIERACIDLVKRLYLGRSRDPSLRSETVPGVIEQTWTSGENVPHRGGIPGDIAQRLDGYKRVVL